MEKIQDGATAETFTTEHYRLVRTEDGWRGEADDSSWQWFDFPDITFTDDECRFELAAETICMAGELDTYREYLDMLYDEIEELRHHIR